MKSLQNTAAGTFIFAVAILTIVSIFGIWDVFSSDVITKSFETLGILAVVAAIVMTSGKYIHTDQESMTPELPNPVFKSIRQTSLGVLITSVSLLALIGILSIWDVISDKDVLYKSLSSIAILGFGAFVIVMVCLSREGNPSFKQKTISPVMILILVIFVWFFIGWGRFFM